MNIWNYDICVWHPPTFDTCPNFLCKRNYVLKQLPNQPFRPISQNTQFFFRAPLMFWWNFLYVISFLIINLPLPFWTFWNWSQRPFNALVGLAMLLYQPDPIGKKLRFWDLITAQNKFFSWIGPRINYYS